MTEISNQQLDDLVRKEISSLLGGNPPGNIDLTMCGGWADTIEALHKAHASGGTAQVRKTFYALAKADDSLTRLIASDPGPDKTTWTAAELLHTEFPDPKWAVPDVIPVGLSFLAGRPKVGKSWLALQVAGAVATGGRVLDRKIDQGKVLYLALEDSPRRLKNRLQTQRVPGSADLVFKMAWPNLAEGGLADLQDEIERGGYSLVVIDTLSRALGRADQQDLAEMTTILGNLQRMAQLFDVAIVLIDHHRKPAAMVINPIDDIIGSTAKAAVADAAIGLVREQGKHGATLKVTGRDLEETELALEWDGLTCCWQLIGEAGQVKKQGFERDLLDAIQTLEALGELATTINLATHLDKDKAQVSRTLGNLVNTRKVIKAPKVGREQPYQVVRP